MIISASAHSGLKQARSTIRREAKEFADVFWPLAEEACRALESDSEEERIAVESLRRSLVLEIVEARERQRQERHIEVEIEGGSK